LLYGGALQLAGSVTARKNQRATASDWMELEKQRGISVTTSVMKFVFDDFEVNLLDTPGHNDFSEDTYRTLTAVDSALMLIDSGKGVETQTIKLMNVCRMRGTPIVTFMNKLDRDGLDPFDLLDNVEKTLNITCVPLSWPIGMGKQFRGVYDIPGKRVILFDPAQEGGRGGMVQIDDVNDNALDELIGPVAATAFREQLEIVVGAGVQFDQKAFLAGKQTPVFFGSALSGFGVEEMFENFCRITPVPQPRECRERIVEADEEKFTGFVFKIQANMDPKHRDRIAFMRVCSGRFERFARLWHVRLGRELRIANPIFFMAQSREILEDAWPGDIVGVHDYGTIEIGDSFTEGETLHFTGIPSFAPEIFRRVRLENPLKTKNLRKGLEQLAQEGAVQLFMPLHSADFVVGVVGQLQLDVLKYRLEAEYDVKGIFENVELATARWYSCDDAKALAEFEKQMATWLAKDVRGRTVYLAESSWRLRFTQEKHPAIRFFETSDGLNQADL
jgi:peptide chain release factor 3